jgi:nucleoid-associated protein YgaU
LAEGVLGKDDAAQVDQTKPVDFPNKPPPPEEGLTSRATPLPVRSSTMPLMQLPRATPPTSFPVRRASDDRPDDLLAGSTVRPIESHIPMQKEVTLEEETIERQPATDQIAQTDAQTSLSVVPTSAEDGVVVVQLNAGESLWTVAQRHYGDGRYFRALAAFNQLEDEDSDGRSPRTLLQLPTAEALRNAFPELLPADPELPSEDAEPATSPGADYVTQAGDTLFSIARDQLGQASRYVELFERNKSILPENTTAALKLPRGIRLKLLPK